MDAIVVIHRKETAKRQLNPVAHELVKHGTSLEELSSSELGNSETDRLLVTYSKILVLLDTNDLGDDLLDAVRFLSDVSERGEGKLRHIWAAFSDVDRNKDTAALMEFAKQVEVPFETARYTQLQRSPHEKQLEMLGSSENFSIVDVVLDRSALPQVKFIPDIPAFVPVDLAGDVLARGVIDEKFLYWDEKGAALWMRLKESEHYEFFTKSYQTLRDNVTEMVSKMRDVVAEEPFPPVDLVPLGVGSAEKEILALRALLECYGGRTKAQRKPIYYIPLDISFPLLQNTVRTLFSDEKAGNAIAADQLRIRPILTDFLKASPRLIRTPNSHRLMLALGVLQNVPEGRLFRSLKEMSTPGTISLVDAEFIGRRSDDELCASYSGGANSAFVEHPLSLLIQASECNEQFRFSNPLTGRTEEGRFSQFEDFELREDLVELKVVENNKIESLAREYGIDPRIKDHVRLSDLSKSRTVVTLLKGATEGVKPLILGYSTKYDYDEFKNYIQTAGFEVIYECIDGEDPRQTTFGYFLLKRR